MQHSMGAINYWKKVNVKPASPWLVGILWNVEMCMEMTEFSAHMKKKLSKASLIARFFTNFLKTFL